jgi:hypothetical protein
VYSIAFCATEITKADNGVDFDRLLTDERGESVKEAGLSRKIFTALLPRHAGLSSSSNHGNVNSSSSRWLH